MTLNEKNQIIDRYMRHEIPFSEMSKFENTYERFKALYLCEPVKKSIIDFRVKESHVGFGWKVVAYFSNPNEHPDDFEIVYDGLKLQEAIHERSRLMYEYKREIFNPNKTINSMFETPTGKARV